MRLNINLASQKYEDVRQFYVRWGMAIGAAGLLTVLLLVLAYLNYSGSAQSAERIGKLEQEIATLQQQRAAAQEISGRPENHDVTAQKNYWNKQIMRRSFSWTQLVNDLQKIMPARAFVTSVHPEITIDNRVKLTVSIKGDKHADALELVQKMEKSERFRGPRMLNEITEKDQRSGATVYKFEISTYYTPTSPPQQRASNREGS